jgi:hypothetical protein
MMVGSIDRTTGRGGRAQNAAESVGVSECMHGADAVPRLAHQGRKMASWGKPGGGFGGLGNDFGPWTGSGPLVWHSAPTRAIDASRSVSSRSANLTCASVDGMPIAKYW